MIKRSNELIYVKRRYLFPFKPLLDYEYRQFGYKKCDVGKTPNSKLFKTVYYVRHKEMPQPILYSLLYGLNFLFSVYRCAIWPIIAILTFIVAFINIVFIHAEIPDSLFPIAQFFIYTSILSVLVIPINLILASTGHNIYVKEDVLAKTNRALSNNGWDTWSSYKDNDARFAPPNIDRKNSSNAGQGNRNTSANSQRNKTNFANNNSNANFNNNFVNKNANANFNNNFVNNAKDSDDDDEIITLETANGELMDFEPIALIANKGKLYALLVPLEKLDGMEDDECLVFECTQNDENGNAIYNIELDDDIIDEVMASYDKLYAEQHS